MNFELCGIEVGWAGRRQFRNRKKKDVLSRDGRKDCEGQSEIFRIACKFTKTKWIILEN